VVFDALYLQRPPPTFARAKHTDNDLLGEASWTDFKEPSRSIQAAFTCPFHNAGMRNQLTKVFRALRCVRVSPVLSVTPTELMRATRRRLASGEVNCAKRPGFPPTESGVGGEGQ
jgi:hypothetical protein